MRICLILQELISPCPRHEQGFWGLGQEVTPHILRHTCATMLLQLGVSVYDVAGVIGTTEDVVRRTYGHHAHDHLRQAVAVFSRRPTPKNSP